MFLPDSLRNVRYDTRRGQVSGIPAFEVEVCLFGQSQQALEARTSKCICTSSSTIEAKIVFLPTYPAVATERPARNTQMRLVNPWVLMVLRSYNVVGGRPKEQRAQNGNVLTGIR